MNGQPEGWFYKLLYRCAKMQFLTICSVGVYFMRQEFAYCAACALAINSLRLRGANASPTISSGVNINAQ
jgi:hypothetical protein